MAKRSVTVVLAALALGACSKSEEVNKKPPPPIRIEAPMPEAQAPSGEIDPALKERLARQEAAARLFEKNVLEPPAPREPRAAPEPVKAPEPAKAAEPAKPEVARRAPVEAPKVAASAPPKAAATPPPSAPAKAAPARAPAKAEAPPRTDVAAAKPSSAAPAPAAARLVTRVDPDFPREAIQSGVDRGVVKVRLTVEATGEVSRVEVLEANPRRVFDRAVVRALSQWKFNEGPAGRTVETEVDFKR